MPKSFTVDILEPGSVGKLISDLESWHKNVFMKQVDDFAMVVAQETVEDVQQAEHVLTGRLRANTDWHDLERVGNGHFMIEIDPVDEHGRHYARTEMLRGPTSDGLNHNFIDAGMRNVGQHIEEWKGLFS